MAWALKEPEGFGDFYPQGRCPGWKERLEEYFNDQFSYDERRKYNNWSQEYESKVIDKFFFGAGSIENHEWPTEFAAVKTHKSLASLVLLANGTLAIDKALQDIIETFEPGIHQSSPIKVTMPKGKIYPTQYFSFAIRNFVDAYIPIEGTFSPYHGGGDRFFANGNDKKAYNQLELSKRVIGGAHLWCDTRLMRPRIFISDALQASIKDAGLRIFKHHKVKEV